MKKKTLTGSVNNGLSWNGQNITFVKESYTNGTTWYRVWSDGWIEQGGRLNAYNYQTITFPKTMANTNYNVSLTSSRTTATTVAGEVNHQVMVSKNTTTSMYVYISNTSGNGTYWKVCGY